MKKLLFLLAFLPSVSLSAFRTDWLQNTSSSVTLNGTTYYWNAGSGTSGQFLTSGGGSIPTLTWTTGASAARPLEVFSNFDATQSSPTLSISIGDSMSLSVSGSTAILNVDISSVTSGLITASSVSANYLTQSSATATYFQIASTPTFMSQSSATLNFLTQSSATATYFQIASTPTFMSQSSATSNFLTQSSAVATYIPFASSAPLVNRFNVVFNAEQAKTPGAAFCDISNSTAMVMPGILCDASTDESVTWSTILTPYTTTTMVADIYYTMVSTNSGSVVHNISVMCASSTYTPVIDTESFAGVNASTVTVPGAIGRMGVARVTLSTMDTGCNFGSIFIMKYNRDANASADTATGDISVRKIWLYEP